MIDVSIGELCVLGDENVSIFSTIYDTNYLDLSVETVGKISDMTESDSCFYNGLFLGQELYEELYKEAND
jgi:hypothetical protein